MRTDLHLVFAGNCRQAITAYEDALHTKAHTLMTYAEAPAGSPTPEGADDLIMHAAIPLGTITLMAADAPPGRAEPLGGFQISLQVADDAELHRIFAALSEGGSNIMPPSPTFWSPLFAMFKDRFGVGWLLSLPAAQS